MRAFLTSCNRPELLRATLMSLKRTKTPISSIRIHEDCGMTSERIADIDLPVCYVSMNVGQIKSIDRFLKPFSDKYYLHLEDDWIFYNDRDWIADSLELMEKDEKIIKVLSRAENIHDVKVVNGIQYLQPTKFYDQQWFGFGWNCGVTRADLLKQFDLLQTENDIDLQIHDAGYKVAYLPYTFYKHIGNKNSTRT